ncbi:MAG: hypothetical protein M1820_001195 [Bogoriella megaspora]|nr:MAG: hypothetical protein M1820_001195 [Bogoriella megaspora]
MAVSFPQQGSWDWFELLGPTLSYARQVAARISAAGIDPHTLEISQVIARAFKMDSIGKYNVSHAVAGLRSYKSFSDLLSFGFCDTDAVHWFVESPGGLICLALCAALAETFHPDIAAAVVHELTEKLNLPREYQPSPRQWSGLIRACSGVLAQSEFATKSDKCMSYHPSPRKLTSDHLKQFSSGRGCPAPQDLADALLEIARVSRGELLNLTVKGCAAAGWLAAFGEWVLGLSVAIYATFGKPELEYCSETCEGKPELAQIKLFFDSAPSSDDHSVTDIQVYGVTVQVKDASNFIPAHATENSHSIVSGRVAWDDCLISAFGYDFKTLLDYRMQVSTGIGSAAKLFEALTKADPMFSPQETYLSRSYFSDAYGNGFIDNTVRWFPELAQMRLGAKKAYSHSLLDAKMNYQKTITDLKHSCHCDRCKEDSGKEDGHYCLVLIFETIIVMSQSLSGISVDSKLYPRRCGLESFYCRQEKLRDETEIALDGRAAEIGPIIYVLEMVDQPAFGGDYSQEEITVERRLMDAMRIFSGRYVDVPSRQSSAISSDGICVYLDSLRTLSTSREHVGRVHVVAGKIQYSQRDYDAVTDSWEETTTWKGPDADKGDCSFEPITMILKPTVKGISVYYNLKSKQGKHLQIEPAGFVTKISRVRGRIHCRRRGCIPVDDIPSVESVRTLYVDNETNREVEIWNAPSHISRCALAFLLIYDEDNHTSQGLLKEMEAASECLSCAIRQCVRDDNGPLIFA